MQNLLVTGGCGFIGSNFIRYLLEESSFSGRIINVDKLTYAGNPENLDGVSDRFSERYIFEKADICNMGDMERIFSEYRIDSVCHFAAESHVDRSISSPESFIDTNVKGTFNLLECSKRACSGDYREQSGQDENAGTVGNEDDSFQLFHHVSTDEVYGTLGESGCFTENTPYSPNSPYSASKAASDHLVRAWHETYSLPVTISNCSNNYGPYQFPEKLIPLMILNALEGKALPVYGNGRNIRDWLFVKDHCRAIWLIMEKGRRGRTYNIGGESERENIAIVEKICSIIDESEKRAPDVGASKDLIRFVKDRPGHDFRYAIDCTRLKEELDWRPEESFESGILKTVRWYLGNMGWVERVKSGEYLRWLESHYK